MEIKRYLRKLMIRAVPLTILLSTYCYIDEYGFNFNRNYLIWILICITCLLVIWVFLKYEFKNRSKNRSKNI